MSLAKKSIHTRQRLRKEPEPKYKKYFDRTMERLGFLVENGPFAYFIKLVKEDNSLEDWEKRNYLEAIPENHNNLI